MKWKNWLTKKTRYPGWNLQPIWVKAWAILVGLPAFGTVAVRDVFVVDIGAQWINLAYGAFFSVALLTTVFIVKALWNHEL